MLTRRTFTHLLGISAVGIAVGSLFGCAPSEAPSKGDSTVAPGPAEKEHQEQVASKLALSAGLVCVTEYAGNTLAIVDPVAGEVVGRVGVGQNPMSAVQVGNRVFVGSSGSGKIAAVPFEDATQVSFIPVGRQPLALCYDAARDCLYVGDYAASGVQTVDVSLGSMTESFELNAMGFANRTDPPPCCLGDDGVGRRTVTMAVAPEGDVLYCANYGTYDIARVDLDSWVELDAFNGVIGPRTLEVSRDGSLLLLAGVGGELSGVEDSLRVIDRATGQVVRKVYVGQAVAGLCQSADGSRVYAIARNSGDVVAFDSATWGEVARATLGDAPDSMAISPDDSYLFIASSEAGALRKVDCESLTVESAVAGFANPKNVLLLV